MTLTQEQGTHVDPAKASTVSKPEVELKACTNCGRGTVETTAKGSPRCNACLIGRRKEKRSERVTAENARPPRGIEEIVEGVHLIHDLGGHKTQGGETM